MRRRVRHRNFVWAIIAMHCLIAILPAHAQRVDPAEASLRNLSRAVAAQRDGSHLSLLFALRQLRDPDLKPLFTKLLESDQWQVQVHAALGLAEIDPGRKIDAALITRLAPQAQDTVLATALDLDLLAADAIPQILKWEDLQPMARLVLMAEVYSPNSKKEIAGMPPAAEAIAQLRTLTDATDEHIAFLSACLMAQLGDADALTAMQERLAKMDHRRAADLNLWLLEAVRRYHLSACLPWVKQLLKPADVDPDVAYRGVYTLLELEAESGLAAWQRFLGEQPSYHQRVRYCTVLLASSSAIPTSLYDRTASNPPSPDEALVNKMIAVGKAISSKSDVVPPLIELLDLGHVKTSDWALDYTEKLPPAQAARIYAHLIDRLSGPSQAGDSIAMAVESTAKLFKIDAEQVLSRLRAADDDGVVQQAILLGLFDATSPAIGEAAAGLRRIGAGRADSMALLLTARYATTIGPMEIDQLGKIAAGGGGVSEVLQVQAAWMYLKHSGQASNAVSQLFAKKD